jgi:hypothetical protein
MRAWEFAWERVLLLHSLPQPPEWFAGEHFACPRCIQLTVTFHVSSILVGCYFP